MRHTLQLKEVSPNIKMTTFFNLLHSRNPPRFVCDLESYLVQFKKDINEIYAIILICNEQNIDIFNQMSTFNKIISTFNLEHYDIKDLIYILQSSILYKFDSSQSEALLNYISILESNNIISSYVRKCIVSTLNTEKKVKEETIESNKDITNFLNFDISKNNFMISLDKIRKVFNVDIPKLNKLLDIFRKKLGFQFDKSNLYSSLKFKNALEFDSIIQDFCTKKILLLGRPKSGKKVLLQTLLCLEANKVIQNNISPVMYVYGSENRVLFFEEKDLFFMKSSFDENISNIAQHCLENFEREIKLKNIEINTNILLNSILNTDKKNIVKNILSRHDKEILKYVALIISPDLPPNVFRHLQIDSYLNHSNIILYLINSNSTNEELFADAKNIINILKKDIENIFVLFTNIDKSKFSMKKIQVINETLVSIIKDRGFNDVKKLNSIKFHYIASSIAHDLRFNTTQKRFNSGFDLASSGIPGLESELLKCIFDKEITLSDVINREFLESILKSHLQNNASEEEKLINQNTLKQMKIQTKFFLNNAKNKDCNLKSLLANLKDNLCYQLIDSLNFILKNKNYKFNLQRLRKTTIGTLVISLQSLLNRLQEQDDKNLKEFLNIFNPKISHFCKSFMKYCDCEKVLELGYKNMLSISNNHYKESKGEDVGNAIVSHLRNNLVAVLHDNMSKNDFRDDKKIKFLDSSFEYYFMLIEIKFNELYQVKIDRFNSFAEDFFIILESIFSTKKEDEDSIKFILKRLELYDS